MPVDLDFCLVLVLLYGDSVQINDEERQKRMRKYCTEDLCCASRIKQTGPQGHRSSQEMVSLNPKSGSDPISSSGVLFSWAKLVSGRTRVSGQDSGAGPVWDTDLDTCLFPSAGSSTVRSSWGGLNRLRVPQGDDTWTMWMGGWKQAGMENKKIREN